MRGAVLLVRASIATFYSHGLLALRIHSIDSGWLPIADTGRSTRTVDPLDLLYIHVASANSRPLRDYCGSRIYQRRC